MLLTHTADWHLQMEAPRCRKDKDWPSTMEGMIKFIVEFNKKKGGTIVNVGDIFNSSQQPPWVVNMFLRMVPGGIVFAGNHDFKHRNLLNIESSSIGHLLKNPKYVACIPKYEDGFFALAPDILLCHRLVFPPESAGLAKFKNGVSVDTLIEKAQEEFPEVKWILLGDNHHKFHHISEEGIHVVNPGSPLIYNASMIGEDCGFYYIDTNKEIVEFISVPDKEDVVTDAYLREEESLSKSIQESLVSISGEDSGSLDFFQINDEKVLEKDNEFKNVYEDIKNTTLQMRAIKGE